MRALNALLLNGAPFRPGKMSADPAKLTPPRRSRTPLTLSRKANHSSSESDNSSCERQIAKRAAFDLEACSDSHPSRLADEPILDLAKGFTETRRDRAVRAALLPGGDGKRFGRQPPPRRTPCPMARFRGRGPTAMSAISLSQVPGRL